MLRRVWTTGAYFFCLLPKKKGEAGYFVDRLVILLPRLSELRRKISISADRLKDKEKDILTKLFRKVSRKARIQQSALRFVNTRSVLDKSIVYLLSATYYCTKYTAYAVIDISDLIDIVLLISTCAG